MRATVISVQHDGLILALADGNHEGWLGSDHWSSDSANWDLATTALDPGAEIDVLPLPHETLINNRVPVSRKLFGLAHIDSSILYETRDVRVDDVGKTLIRGVIGSAIPAVITREAYMEWLDSRNLSSDMLDHGVLARGDTVRATILRVSSDLSAVELDLCAHLDSLDRDIAQAVGQTIVPKESDSLPSTSRTLPKLRRNMAASINPVLLVDDNSKCRESIATTLRREGLTVETLQSTEDTHRFLQARRSLDRNAPAPPNFRLAIIDPNLDTDSTDLAGMELARSLINSPNRCRVILMTGEVNHVRKLKRWPDLELHGYLEKPFTIELLLGTIEEACALKKPVRLADWLGAEPQQQPGTAILSLEKILPPKGAEDLSMTAVVTTLARTKPGTVVHVFELHPRSLRARSLAQSGPGLDWLPLRGKIGKSVIKDAAFGTAPLVFQSVHHENPAHLWTRRMLDYRSFCGVPVHVKGRQIALVAFHRDADAFDAAFVTSARLSAEQVARDAERQMLYAARRNEATLASFGMALASLAHELASDLTALDANLADVAKVAVGKRAADSAVTLEQVRADVAEMTRKTRTLRGTRLRAERASITDCLRKAATACRTVVHETTPNPERILVEPVAGESFDVSAPAASLVIVFFNLYLNAAQQISLASAVRRSGRVWQTCTPFVDRFGREVIRVRVHDTGPGIHHDDWERVFEPGYTTKPNGSGLGLYICRHILSGIGGSIAVTRSAIWSGTTVTVTLPVASEET